MNIIEGQEYRDLINNIQSTFFIFDKGKYKINPNDNSTVKQLVQKLNKLNDYSIQMKKNITLKILGHADTTGDEENNIWLSKMRAQFVKDNLISNGLKIKNINIVGLGSQTNSYGATNKNISDRNVSFKIITD